jgi:hypothetical protein
VRPSFHPSTEKKFQHSLVHVVSGSFFFNDTVVLILIYSKETILISSTNKRDWVVSVIELMPSVPDWVQSSAPKNQKNCSLLGRTLSVRFEKNQKYF